MTDSPSAATWFHSRWFAICIALPLTGCIAIAVAFPAADAFVAGELALWLAFVASLRILADQRLLNPVQAVALFPLRSPSRDVRCDNPYVVSQPREPQGLVPRDARGSTRQVGLEPEHRDDHEPRHSATHPLGTAWRRAAAYTRRPARKKRMR
jgi:hypothetical protein